MPRKHKRKVNFIPISSASGFKYIKYRLLFSNEGAFCRLIIDNKNKYFFDELSKFRSTIEIETGKIWEWEDSDRKNRGVVTSKLSDVDFFNSNDWQKINEFFLSELNVMHKYLEKINQTLKNEL